MLVFYQTISAHSQAAQQATQLPAVSATVPLLADHLRLQMIKVQQVMMLSVGESSVQ
jgi:hypothetical protein